MVTRVLLAAILLAAVLVAVEAASVTVEEIVSDNGPVEVTRKKGPKYRFEPCTDTYLWPYEMGAFEHVRYFQYNECALCCRETGYNYFKWEKSPMGPGFKKCSCTQDVRQIIQMKDYLRNTRADQTSNVESLEHDQEQDHDLDSSKLEAI